MNERTLIAGRDFDAALRDLSDTASEWVADLGPDPWPGRRSEALVYHSRLLEALQQARTEAGELVTILAQDVAP